MGVSVLLCYILDQWVGDAQAVNPTQSPLYLHCTAAGAEAAEQISDSLSGAAFQNASLFLLL